MDEPAVVRCAECGRPATHDLKQLGKRFESDLRFCRDCYERLASRIMRPDTWPVDTEDEKII